VGCRGNVREKFVEGQERRSPEEKPVSVVTEVMQEKKRERPRKEPHLSSSAAVREGRKPEKKGRGKTTSFAIKLRARDENARRQA